MDLSESEASDASNKAKLDTQQWIDSDYIRKKGPS